MVPAFTRALALLLALTPIAQAAGPTDPVAHVDARRKAKGAAERAGVTIDYVLALAREAKAEMNTVVFTGIKEKLNLAATDVMELRKEKGADDPEVVRLIQRLRDTGAEVQGIIDYVKANKTASVAMPADVYSGADKAKIRAAVIASWKNHSPDEKVLAVRFPNASWERRRTEEKVGSEWKKFDVESMSVRVIVDKDAETVTIHGVIVQINHHKNEDLVVGPKGTFAPEDMARKNLKL